MRLIAKIREMVYKVKDYDRLGNDYCTVLNMVTGARLSKPNYTMDSVREAYCVGTGWRMDDEPPMKYIGTIQQDGLVWHYYRAISWRR